MGFVVAFVVAVVLGCARVSTASVSGSSNNNADTRDIVASRPVILSGIMDHLQSTSRRLRGSGTDVSEAFSTLEEVRDIAVATAQTWQAIIAAIQSKDRAALESFVRESLHENTHVSIQNMHDEFEDESESENSLQLPEESYVDEVLDAATAEELAAFISPVSIENALDLSQNLVLRLNRVLESRERSLQSGLEYHRRLDEKEQTSLNSFYSEGGTGHEDGRFWIDAGGISESFHSMLRTKATRDAESLLFVNMQTHKDLHATRRQSLQSDYGLCLAQCDLKEMSHEETCCDRYDWCTWNRLVECTKGLTPYDLGVLMTRGFIEKNPTAKNYANFTVNITDQFPPFPDLNMFSADLKIPQKYNRIQTLAAYTLVGDEQDGYCGNQDIFHAEECWMAASALWPEPFLDKPSTSRPIEYSCGCFVYNNKLYWTKPAKWEGSYDACPPRGGTGAVHVCKLTSSPNGSTGQGSQTITEAHYLKLLNEFVTVCDPVSDSCPDKNKQTFQLTVDQVCAARNTTTKLKFKVLKEKFDPCTPGLPGFFCPLEYNKCARGPTGGTHWGNYDVNYPAMFNSCECDYVSYKSCAQFLADFDTIYDHRDKAKYPLGNPMVKQNLPAQQSSSDGNGYEIFERMQFPIQYKFDIDEEGRVGSWQGTFENYTIAEIPPSSSGCGQFPGSKPEPAVFTDQTTPYGKVDQPCYSCLEDDKLGETVMEFCDQSLTLLAGLEVSAGEINQIAKDIKNHGPERMPGSCCLDTPGNSEYPGVPYDPETLQCEHIGPWHLGLSSSACSQAGGKWTRSPCLTLQECITERPSNGTAGYSQSFENFAKTINITDASVPSQCENARQKLGFEANFADDSEVCIHFHNLMCGETFDVIDQATKGADMDPKSNNLPFEPAHFPPETKLQFKELKNPDFKLEENTWKGRTAIQGITGTISALETAFNEWNIVSGGAKERMVFLCQSIPPMLIAVGEGLPNPERVFCVITISISLVAFNVQKFVSRMAIFALKTTLMALTFKRPSYDKMTYDSFVKYGKWTVDALTLINNENIPKMETLHGDGYKWMQYTVNSLANYTNCVANFETYRILKALNASGPDIDKHGCKVQDFHEGMDLLGMQGPVQPYTKLLTWPHGMVFDKLDTKIDLILDKLEIVHPKNGAGGKRSKKSKAAKLEKDEDTLFTRRLQQEPDVKTNEIIEGFEQVVDAKVGQLEAKVGQMDSKIDAMMKMMAELVLQNHVQNEVESN